MPAHAKQLTPAQREAEIQYNKLRKSLAHRHRAATKSNTLESFHANSDNQDLQLEINRLAAILPNKQPRTLVVPPEPVPCTPTPPNNRSGDLPGIQSPQSTTPPTALELQQLDTLLAQATGALTLDTQGEPLPTSNDRPVPGSLDHVSDPPPTEDYDPSYSDVDYNNPYSPAQVTQPTIENHTGQEPPIDLEDAELYDQSAPEFSRGRSSDEEDWAPQTRRRARGRQRARSTPSVASSDRALSPITDAIRQSFRSAGCKCEEHQSNGFAGRQESERATGLSINEFVNVCSPTMADVLAHTASKDTLPTISRDDFDWERLLSWEGRDESTALGEEHTEGSEGEPHTPHRATRLSLEKSCLLMHEDQPPRITRQWDVDAVHLPLTSLAACTEGFHMNYVPNFGRTISKDLHIPLTKLGIDARACKHLCLGRAEGSSGYDIYVFFPNLPVSGRVNKRKERASTKTRLQQARCFLTEVEQAAWIDQCVIPSLRDVYNQGVIGSHPRSFNEANCNARARQKEQLSNRDRSVITMTHYLPNHLQSWNPQHPTTASKTPLELFWSYIVDRAQAHGSMSDVQLVAITYNTKHRLRHNHIQSLITHTLEHEITSKFDRRYVDEANTYVDIAYTDYATSSHENANEPIVLLRRTRCNMSDIKELGLKNASQLHQWQSTADASAVRAKASNFGRDFTYVQAYNEVKNPFAPDVKATEPFFESPAYRSLAFSPRLIDEYRKLNKSTRWEWSDRRRTIHSFKKSIGRLHSILEVNQHHGSGFGARQEYRISLTAARALAERFASEDTVDGENSTAAELQLDAGYHWPYFAIRQSEVMAFIRLQTNRWLTGVCGLLSIHYDEGRAARSPANEAEQHARASMLDVLLTVLSTSINSRDITLQSRLHHSTYNTVRERPISKSSCPRARRRVRIVVEGSSDEFEPSDHGSLHGDGAQSDGSHGPQESAVITEHYPEPRIGLGLAASLRDTNNPWLPKDVFDWSNLSFKPDVLVHTAWATSFFEQHFSRATLGRESVFRGLVQYHVEQLGNLYSTAARTGGFVSLVAQDECFRPLYQACVFRYCSHILTQLLKRDHIGSAAATTLTDEEKRGELGLSYDLVRRATGSVPCIQFARGEAGQGVGKTGGWSQQPLNWHSRVQLLFGWDDGFVRGNWENAPWRDWTRHCFTQIQQACDEDAAITWMAGFGSVGVEWLRILPHYQEDKIWYRSKAKDSRGMVTWTAAQPIKWGEEEFDSENWELIRVRAKPKSRGRLRKKGGGSGKDEDEADPTTNDLEDIYRILLQLLQGQRFDSIDALLGTHEE